MNASTSVSPNEWPHEYWHSPQIGCLCRRQIILRSVILCTFRCSPWLLMDAVNRRDDCRFLIYPFGQAKSLQPAKMILVQLGGREKN